VDVPDVSYARSGDVAIAYQAVGEGPPDLVFVPFFTSLFTLWQLPSLANFLSLLAAGRRLVVLNTRGTGLSDQPRGITIESRMDDLRAVIDDVRADRVSLLAVGQTTAPCVLFATTYPERVERVVLYRPFTRGARSPDYPWAPPRDYLLERLRESRRTWGDRGELETRARLMNPQWADDDAYVEWFVWNTRLAVSPGAMVEFRRMWLETDVTDVLPSIRVPTLVLSKADARDECEHIASQIPESEHVVLPGVGQALHETKDAAEAIISFLAAKQLRTTLDRVVATVLFTDIVDSTLHAVRLGDRDWRNLLAQHNALVRDRLSEYRGHELDTAGDGFLATFDGPGRAIACALAVIHDLRSIGIDVRAGLHTGEFERLEGKLAGIGVTVGARVAAQARGGEVLVSSTVRDLVAGSGLEFEDRGAHELKGVPGEWRLYAVNGP
jgi:class 3 adenylate cyclase